MATQKSGPYAMAEAPPIWSEFRQILNASGFNRDLDEIERFDFYNAAREPDVALTIATADQRIYANIILTIGVVTG
jgi:L-fucose mutarotase